MEHFGQIAYEAYVQSCGGKSIHGEDLPDWTGQSPEIRAHWNAAAQAVVKAVVGDAPSDEDRIRAAILGSVAALLRTLAKTRDLPELTAAADQVHRAMVVLGGQDRVTFQMDAPQPVTTPADEDRIRGAMAGARLPCGCSTDARDHPGLTITR